MCSGSYRNNEILHLCFIKCCKEFNWICFFASQVINKLFCNFLTFRFLLKLYFISIQKFVSLFYNLQKGTIYIRLQCACRALSAHRLGHIMRRHHFRPQCSYEKNACHTYWVRNDPGVNAQVTV